jgi:hypothetical protein
MQEKGIIYKAADKDDGKIYIGQTHVGLKKRKKAHFDYGNKQFEKFIDGKIEDFNENLFSIQYYLKGEENFEWEIIDESYVQNALNEKEIYWIQHYKDLGYEVYNIAKGGHHTFPSSIYYNEAIDDAHFEFKELYEVEIDHGYLEDEMGYLYCNLNPLID